MSELIQKNDNRATIRWKLLTGVSALALTAYVSSATMAEAEDVGQPQVWIEFGGQLSRLQDSQEIFKPHFVTLTPPPFSPPQEAERPPLFSIDGNAAMTFQPKDSDWIFSASIQYGRGSSSKHVHHESYPDGFQRHYQTGAPFGLPVLPSAARFTEARVKQTEDHTIVDFQAGKDLGLGVFGDGASSSVSLGVRFAQFKSKSRATLGEDPDWRFNAYYTTVCYGSFFCYTTEAVLQAYHTFQGMFLADRSFHGLGPSLSWKSSVPFAGNSHDGQLTLDWGINAALLFGRQKTKTQHQTTGRYHPDPYFKYLQPAKDNRPITYQHPAIPVSRSRNVTVPNVGGFAGISFNYADAKVSFGYRADFFFNAIDGGIDTRKSENRAFYGPYASISIGLGD